MDAPHLLLAHGGHLLVISIAPGGIGGLSPLLLLELAQVGLHVELLLGLVEGVDADLEELVLDAVVLLLGVGYLLGRLIVAELSGFGQHGDVCGRVHLLQAHLQLVQ